MRRKVILFDLDGTITDSGEGIINCVQLALSHFGLPHDDRNALRCFVGPPLRDMFIQHGVPEDSVEEAIRVYRSRYTTVGIFENYPYPGIRELLDLLNKDGFRLFIATSKPESMARQVLDHFDLTRYFEEIAGSTLDGKRDTKSDVIAYLLEKTGAFENAVMVGDTHYDVIGASEHKIPTIGVSWGYGKCEKMRSAGAIAIADSPAELYTLLKDE